MPGSTCLWIILFLLTIVWDQTQAVPCGYPGSSQNGRPDRVQEYYPEGHAVTYSCDQGYFLMGPSTRKCTDNGTWTPSRIPLCDSRLGGLEEFGSAESSEPLHEYPPRLAIDGDAGSCSYTGRTPPRWWRLDLGRSYRILSVALTVADPQSEQNLAVSILGLNGNSAIYQRCGYFSGKFASSSLILPCGGGGTTTDGGLFGRYLHIEDHRKELNYFGLCEVDVLVLRERYDCGQPERPVNSYTVRLKPDQVEYRCVAGHKLVGNRRRQCLTNGQWSGNQPLCIEVRCPPPDPIENGSVRVRSLGVGSGGPQAVLGSLANYTCDQGFTLKAAPGSGTNGSRLCNEDGNWSPTEPPTCQPVDCGPPFLTSVFPEGTTIRLLNGSLTGQGATARLRCPEGYEPSSGHDDVIRCRADGAWTRPRVKCLSGLNVASSPVEAAREEPGEAVTLGLVLGLVGTILLLTMVLAVLCLILRRQRSCVHIRSAFSSPGECEAPRPPRRKRKTKSVILLEPQDETMCDKSPGARRKLELRCLAKLEAEKQLKAQLELSETKREEAVKSAENMKLESETEPKTETESETENDLKTEPKLKSELVSETEMKPETVSETETKPETESERNMETESKALKDEEPEEVVVFRLPRKIETKSQSETESDLESKDGEINHVATDQKTKVLRFADETDANVRREAETESEEDDDETETVNDKTKAFGGEKINRLVKETGNETETESDETESEEETQHDKKTNYDQQNEPHYKVKSSQRTNSETESESEETESEDETQTINQTAP